VTHDSMFDAYMRVQEYLCIHCEESHPVGQLCPRLNELIDLDGLVK
jgi:hypothetical protein